MHRYLPLVVVLIFVTSPLFAESCKLPRSLRFAIIPAEKTTNEIAGYQPLLALLTETTGIPVESVIYDSYAATVLALVHERLDIAMLGAISYIKARNKNPNIQAFASVSRKPGIFQPAGSHFYSLLIVNADSSFHRISDIRGTTLALQNQGSTSGYLVPHKLFSKEVNTALNQYFSTILYSGGHDRTLFAVLDKRVDAGFLSSHRLQNMLHNGMLKPDDIRILWTSPLIPLNPFVMQKNICDPLKEKIKQTFLNIQSYSKGRELMRNIHIDGFITITDSDYNIIRHIERE